MEILIYVATLVLTFAFIGFVSFFSEIRTKKKLKLPPGPYPLPIIGNILQLGSKPHKSLAKLAQIYGPIISLNFGQTKTIVISSPTLAKEIFHTNDLVFSDRIAPTATQAHDHPNHSMIFLPVHDGPLWRNLRRISNSCILSNHKLDANQEIRRNKVQRLLSHVEERCRDGKAIEFDRLAFTTSLDSMSGVILSLDLSDSNSDTVKEFKEIVRCIADECVKPNLIDFFPILSHVLPNRIKAKVTILFGRLFSLFDRLFDERMRARKRLDYVPKNDMLDSLLSLAEEDKEQIDTKTIKHLFMDLLTAGTGTTSSTLEWAMAELLRNPQTLRKAQVEIEQTIGRDNMIQESDIARLPYLRAIIKETFRLHPVAPLLVPRKARASVTISGYTIPKDAQVMVNAWAIGRDPSVWENPNLFMPERFLGSPIDVRGQHFELIPFGAGRRICPGLPLAMRMLHLILGSLIQRFSWKLEDGVTPETLDMDDSLGTTVHMAQPLRAIPVKVNG